MTTTETLIVSLAALAAVVAACVTVVLAARVAARSRVELAQNDLAARAFRDEATPPSRVGQRVTVHTKRPDDQTIFGVLVAEYADRLVLESCEYVTQNGPRPMPGVQHFATADVAWVDVHQLVAELVPHAPAAGDGD